MLINDSDLHPILHVAEPATKCHNKDGDSCVLNLIPCQLNNIECFLIQPSFMWGYEYIYVRTYTDINVLSSIILVFVSVQTL